MPRLFLSYAKSARAHVDVLAADLQGLDCETWFDSSLEGGQHWWEEILERIRASDCFVFCLTPDALDSGPCRLELEYAVALARPLLPVLLGDIETSLLPESLALVQYIDYRAADKASLVALSRALRGMTEAPPLPHPLPAPPDVPVSPLARLQAAVRQSDPLDAQQQSALILELKDKIRDRQDESAARGLLADLRERRDLLAYLAEEIDEVLGHGQPSAPPQAATTLRKPEPTPESTAPRETPAATPSPAEPALDPGQSEVVRDGRGAKWTGVTRMPVATTLEHARAAAIGLGWEVESVGPDRLEARVGVSLTSWGNAVVVTAVELDGSRTTLEVSSKPSLQLFDWGKSAATVTRLVEAIATVGRRAG